MGKILADGEGLSFPTVGQSPMYPAGYLFRSWGFWSWEKAVTPLRGRHAEQVGRGCPAVVMTSVLFNVASVQNGNLPHNVFSRPEIHRKASQWAQGKIGIRFRGGVQPHAQPGRRELRRAVLVRGPGDRWGVMFQGYFCCLLSFQQLQSRVRVHWSHTQTYTVHGWREMLFLPASRIVFKICITKDIV